MKTLGWRLAFLIPLVLFGVYLLVAVFGIIADAFGAQDLFYCTVYCKIAVAVLITAVLATVCSQVRACTRTR